MIKFKHISDVFHKYSYFICHRKPERTFKIKNTYFPVCARCTGFYIAAISYFGYVYYFYVDYNIQLILLAILMLTPAAIDGLTQFYTSRESNNVLRFFTGILGGIGLGIILKAIKWYIYLGLQ
ncbi:MAG: DUF2085 domain-containing protein [Methanobacteriaceae archaeon]